MNSSFGRKPTAGTARRMECVLPSRSCHASRLCLAIRTQIKERCSWTTSEADPEPRERDCDASLRNFLKRRGQRAATHPILTDVYYIQVQESFSLQHEYRAVSPASRAGPRLHAPASHTSTARCVASSVECPTLRHLIASYAYT